MGTKKKKITPSQNRYNKKVPATTFRMDSDTKQKLNELFEASKAETWGIFFKRLVGDYELKLKSIEEARKAGYESGFSDARSRYAVSFQCPDCGQTIFINTPELKAKVRKLIAEAGWVHSACPEPNLPRPNLPRPTPPKPTPPNMSRPNPNPPVVPVEKSNNQERILRFIQDNKNANSGKSLP
jgi:predicted transcriptional regulator